MRIFTNGRPKGHTTEGHPYIDIEPSILGVNIFFSDEDGYYICRREEISNAEIIDAINEIINRPYENRKF